LSAAVQPPPTAELDELPIELLLFAEDELPPLLDDEEP
jgi:hypothetical protein